MISEKMKMEDLKKWRDDIYELVVEEIKAWGYDKRKYLWCLHCEQIIKTENLMVSVELYQKPKYKYSMHWLCCPYKDCDGDPLDWFDKDDLIDNNKHLIAKKIEKLENKNLC